MLELKAMPELATPMMGIPIGPSSVGGSPQQQGGSPHHHQQASPVRAEPAMPIEPPSVVGPCAGDLIDALLDADKPQTTSWATLLTAASGYRVTGDPAGTVPAAWQVETRIPEVYGQRLPAPAARGLPAQLGGVEYLQSPAPLVAYPPGYESKPQLPAGLVGGSHTSTSIAESHFGAAPAGHRQAPTSTGQERYYPVSSVASLPVSMPTSQHHAPMMDLNQRAALVGGPNGGAVPSQSPEIISTGHSGEMDVVWNTVPKADLAGQQQSLPTSPTSPAQSSPVTHITTVNRVVQRLSGVQTVAMDMTEIKDGERWKNHVLLMGAKERNEIIRAYRITKQDAEVLKKASRRLKQNIAQQRYLRRKKDKSPEPGMEDFNESEEMMSHLPPSPDSDSSMTDARTPPSPCPIMARELPPAPQPQQLMSHDVAAVSTSC